jgi:tetratricopeptide (TPR) repeat protein
VLAQPPDPEAEELVARVFTRPSLFEQRCPHWVEPWKRAYRAGLSALAAGDIAQAALFFERALEDVPTQPDVLSAWGRLTLTRGETGRVIERLRAAVETDSLADATLWSRLGDAYALGGQVIDADSAYARAHDATPTYWRTTRAALALRRQLAPEALAVLLDVGPAPARAARLADYEAPEARVLAALLWAEAGDYAAARETLEDVRPQSVPGVAPERLVWLARFTYTAGDRLDAIAYAERAARAYDERGAPNAAAQQRDLADALRWVVLREDPAVVTPEALPG